MSDDQRKPATRAVHLGRDPGKFLGAVNTPVFRASTMLFPTVAELEQAARGEYAGIGYGLHGLPTVTDLQDTVAAIEGAHRALAVPSGLTATTLPLLALLRAGDHVLVTDAVYGPTRRFCNNHLLRLGIEVSYYDPLLGRRDRARVPAEHAPRVHRVAGLADVLRAGYSGDRRGRASARRARRHRQFVGDALRVPLVRPWRRRVGARGDQVHRRPLGRAFGADPRERSDVPGAAPALDGHGRDRIVRRLLPRAARPAHAAVAPRPARRERARDCAMAEDAAGSARGDLSGAARLARPRAVEARFHRRVGTVRGRAPAGGEGTHRRDARRHAALRHGLELGRIREPHHSDLSGARADRHDVGCRRSVPAARDRARRPRRPDRGPGGGLARLSA